MHKDTHKQRRVKACSVALSPSELIHRSQSGSMVTAINSRTIRHSPQGTKQHWARTMLMVCVCVSSGKCLNLSQAKIIWQLLVINVICALPKNHRGSLRRCYNEVVLPQKHWPWARPSCHPYCTLLNQCKLRKQVKCSLWVRCIKWAQIVCECSPQIGLIGVVSFTGNLQKLCCFLNTGVVSSFQIKRKKTRLLFFYVKYRRNLA